MWIIVITLPGDPLPMYVGPFRDQVDADDHAHSQLSAYDPHIETRVLQPVPDLIHG